jgi:DNA-binding NtrC family response regulator
MPQPGVLLVDPDQTLVGPARQTLEAEGFAVRLAGTGAHALEAIGDGEVAAVLLSLGLREPPATTLLTEVAQRWPDLPVIAVTAPGGRGEGFAARQAGAWDYLEPPGDLVRERLLSVLASSLDRARLRRELGSARAAASDTLNLEARERQAIVAALEATRWNKQAAARLLGLHRPTLYAKMRKHGIPHARPH